MRTDVLVGGQQSQKHTDDTGLRLEAALQQVPLGREELLPPSHQMQKLTRDGRGSPNNKAARRGDEKELHDPE